MLKIILCSVVAIMFLSIDVSKSQADEGRGMISEKIVTSQSSKIVAVSMDKKMKQSTKLKLIKTYKGFSSPTGIAVDRGGNLYVSNWSGGTVTKVDLDGRSSVFVEGLGAPAGVVFDKKGDLYIADYSKDVIYKVKPTGKKTIFAKGLHTPTGISFMSDGDLLVSNRGSDEIVKIDKTGKVKLVAKGMRTPVGVVEDIDGNLFVTNYGGGIIKVTSSGVITTFSKDFKRPGVGIDISSKDQIFAVDNGDGCVRLILDNGDTEIVVDDIGGSVALLIHGNILYVGSWNTGSVYAYTIE